MNRIPTLLFALLLACTSVSASAGTRRGDANGDGQVTVADVMMIVKVILGHAAGNDACDVNGDKTVSVADVSEVVKIILSGTLPESESTEIADDPPAWEPANAPRRVTVGLDTGRQIPPGTHGTAVMR